MATSYGKNITVTIYGGSHDDKIGVTVSGLPAGFKFDMEELMQFMERRAPGRNSTSTARKEADIPEFISGVTDDFTLTGEELHAIIRNTNQRSSDYSNTSFVPRPSHADFAAKVKYGNNVDLRGGGHFSGRLTAPMCIVGGICLQYLRSRGIEIGAHVYSIKDIYDSPFDPVEPSSQISLLKKRADLPMIDEQTGIEMRKLVEEARKEGDSVGGIIECAAIGLPIGLGEHMFCGVENRISGIIFGIPAVKAIEFGEGFSSTRLFGSENNDPYYTDGKKVFLKTNRSGGIVGGMTTGMPLIFRAAIKPTPSIFKEQDSVDMTTMTPTRLQIKGRHDPCIAFRAVPVFEAATAIAIYDMILDET